MSDEIFLLEIAISLFFLDEPLDTNLHPVQIMIKKTNRIESMGTYLELELAFARCVCSATD